MNSQLFEDKTDVIALDWYWSTIEDGKIFMKIRPIYPANTPKKDIVIKDLREFVEKRIKNDLDGGFLKIDNIKHDKVVIVFNSNKWMKDNFLKNPKVKFHLPRTLEWKFKKRLPDTLMSHVSWNTVREFIEKQFKEYLKDNNKTVFKKKLKIMKKVNYNWFDYEADLQLNKIFVRMKPRVMFTLVAAGYAAKKVLAGK